MKFKKLHRRIQSPNLLQWTKHILKAVSKLFPTEEEVKLEEGVDDLLQEQTGENDPYDMSIASIVIYENQVLPIGIHNLSKSFRPNLATTGVLSLGTKFIPKWKFEEGNNAFKIFNDFIRKMNNKVYFTETKPGVFERNAKFKLKSNFVAHIQYKEIDMFGWRVREKINEVIERMVKHKFGQNQNMSNKEKSALRNLIRAKK